MSDVALAKNGAGEPVAYEVLAIALYFEPLLVQDEKPLRAMAERIMDWIGPRLRWSREDGRLAPSDFQTLSDAMRTSALLLDKRSAIRLRTPLRGRASELGGAATIMHGGAEASFASPYTIEWRVQVHPRHGALPALRVMVPVSTDPVDVARVAGELAGLGRVRWGNVGLSYARSNNRSALLARDVIHAHAMRHPGFDVGEHGMRADRWDELRSVSWISIVGPALRAELGAAPLAPIEGLEIQDDGPCTFVRAGNAPQAGDMNRLDIPQAYRASDKLLRKIRAREDDGFAEPWTRASTEHWLGRLERTID
jgi:hypothetical protein